MRHILLIALVVSIHGTSTAQSYWERTGYGLLSGKQNYLIVDVVNLGTTPIWRPEATGYDPRDQAVTGHTNENPSWSAKFTPLSFATIWAEYSWEGFILQPGYQQRGIMKWDYEVGFEKWAWTEDPFLWPVYERFRDWHSNPVWDHVIRPYVEPH